MMPLRGLATKGSRYALETVELLRREATKYKFLAYGNFSKTSVPSHIEYHYKPSNSELSRLYNRASIFICPSIIGAFTMPLLEAMASGCATVTSNSIGINEYAKNNINSIIVPIKDSKAMASAVKLLAENPNLKRRIALNGIKTAKAFSYDAMHKSFMSAVR
jgi:glycosyltransferase involved in cell wall biosynthesis